MISIENEKSGVPTDSQPVDDLEVFSKIVAAMKCLDPDARARLFRTLATFFDIHVSEGTARGIKYSQVSTSPQPAASFSEDRALSPKQFLFEKKPLTDVERMACLAYYLTHYLQTPHFKTLDLSKLNTEAAQIKFSNPAAAVENAGQAGLLVQAGKGQKQLSALGELYVQALPDRIAAREAIAHGKPRRNRGKSRSAEKDSA
jgi:hypothetical protein